MTEARSLLGWFGLALYVGVGVFPYLLSGLLIPPAALVVLMACWGAGFVPALRLARRRPVWALAAAPVALAFWFIYVSVGSAIFGWTA